jgi:hypothetical protein
MIPTKFVRSLAVTGLACASLLACSPTGQLDPTAIATACQTACGFLPLVSSVTSVLNANGTITSIEAAVQAICNAFTAQAASGKLKALAVGSQITIDVPVGGGKVVAATGTVVAAPK